MSKDAELGIDRQREDCHAVAKRMDWTVIEYIDNDRSAVRENVKREAYDDMLDAVRDGRIDAIISWRSDRLYRRTRDLLPLIDLIQGVNKAGKRIPIETVQTGLIDLTTDSGRMTAKILAAVSENEGEVRTARQKRANKQKAESGKGWGRRAFGYKGMPDKPDWGDHVKPQIVPEEAEAVAKAFAAVLAGASLYGIARDWNNAGLRTSQGAHPWGTTSVRRTLQNPRYAGLRTYQGKIVGSGDWPVIVDRDTWEAVNYLLDGRKSLDYTQDKARTQLLGGILRCGQCQKGLGVGRRSNGPRVYKCKTVGCNSVSRKMDDLDEWVQYVIVGVLKREPWLLPADKPEGETVAELREKLKAIETRMEATVEDFKGSDLPPSYLRNLLEDMQSRADALTERIQRSVDVDVFEGFIDAEDVQAVWESLPVDRKRAVINKLCDGIVVSRLGKGSGSKATGTGVEFRWRKPYQRADLHSLVAS